MKSSHPSLPSHTRLFFVSPVPCPLSSVLLKTKQTLVGALRVAGGTCNVRLPRPPAAIPPYRRGARARCWVSLDGTMGNWWWIDGHELRIPHVFVGLASGGNLIGRWLGTDCGCKLVETPPIGTFITKNGRRGIRRHINGRKANKSPLLKLYPGFALCCKISDVYLFLSQNKTCTLFCPKTTHSICTL